MRKNSCLLNLTLLIILLIASCDVKIQSKSDVDKLCQANEHEKLYEWVIVRLSSSTIVEIKRDDPLLSDAISCIISYYRSLDSTSSEASTIRMWLSNMESFHFSRSGVRELETIPRIFLSNQYQIQEFEKLFILYIENESSIIPSSIDSMLHHYQQNQFRTAYEDFISKRLTRRKQHATLKSLLAKLSPYILPQEGSANMTWCDSIIGSLDKEIERAIKVKDNNALRANALDNQLQRLENELDVLQDELERINNFDEETNSLENRVKSLNQEKNRAYNENRMTSVSGNIIGLSSKTSYSNIYECSDNQGYHFLLETFYTSFNSQGSFSVYAQKQPDVAITTVNGFQQNWAKWAEVSYEDYIEHLDDRIAVKEKLAEAKALLEQRPNKGPVDMDKTLKRQITQKSLTAVNLKEVLGSLRITTDPILDDYVSWIPGGSFMMGNNSEKQKINASPVHEVYLDGFYMGRTEITFSQYINFLNDIDVSQSGMYNYHKLIELDYSSGPITYMDGFYFSSNKRNTNSDYPVSNVTWYGAVEYCNWLSNKTGKKVAYIIWDEDDIVCDWTANGYRLPTEAEWEYAAKNGDRSKRPLSVTTNKVVDNSRGTHPVGNTQPNVLGLYDMSGNVSEWCWDWHDGYRLTMEANPRGASSGINRIIRGGSSNNAARSIMKPRFSSGRAGFRVVRAN